MPLPNERMSRGLRYAVFAVFGVVWLTGCLWLILHQFFAKAGPFGVARHPWESPTMLLHGILAVGSTYLLGWISAHHVIDSWGQGRRRLGGGALAAVLAVLTVSGFALFFISDDYWQRINANAHELLGLGVTVIALQHWYGARKNGAR